MADSSKSHSVLSIPNIKIAIPITLDLDSGDYHSWTALFKVQAEIHDVVGHIMPLTNSTEKQAYEKGKSDNPSLWKRVDAAVRQWIYATVSRNILTAIIKDTDTAQDAWRKVADLFQDNKNTRAMYLTQELYSTSLADFTSVNAYCNRLKVLADQLSNVDASVSETTLVLRMLQGVTDPYRTFASVMLQREPLPTFAAARSQLSLEETTQNERAKAEAQAAALYTSQHPSGGNSGNQLSNNNNWGHNNSNGKGRGPYKGKQKNGGQRHTNSGGNYGGRNSQQRGGGGSSQSYNGQHPSQSNNSGGWEFPPSPYPTQQMQQQQPSQPWHRPPPPGFAPRRPASPYPQHPQAHMATTVGAPAYNNAFVPAGEYGSQYFVPTQLDSAFTTGSLTPPEYNNAWLMDTGATSHMSSTADRNTPDEM